MKEKNVEILECTLRDGSYKIDFQFTEKQTYDIVKFLYQVGFKRIEVGHGLGLGASLPQIGIAAEKDETYIKAAKEAAPEAKISCFFIPTIGKLEDIKKAREYGLDVLRIGTNITEYHFGKKAIELAKSLGMEVSWNLMKSYAVDAEEFKKIVEIVFEWGADQAVLVDSAGCMFPNEVEDYLRGIKVPDNCKLGFHGHNNLGFASTNVIKAIENGVEIIDTTMLGMGRSAGNAQTEIILFILQKMGYLEEIDVFKLMSFSKEYLKTIMKEPQGINSIDVACGMGHFHSSFIKLLKPVTEKYDLEIERIIYQMGKISPVRFSDEIAEQICQISRNIGEEYDK